MRPLLDHIRDSHLFFLMEEQLSRVQTPSSVNDAPIGTIDCFTKTKWRSPRERSWDIIRRLVARTMSQQLSRAVEVATAPFQHAITTRAGTECIAHALQALTESDPRCITIVVDGIGAFDLISRSAMLEATRGLHGGQEALLFVRLFYGQP